MYLPVRFLPSFLSSRLFHYLSLLFTLNSWRARDKSILILSLSISLHNLTGYAARLARVPHRSHELRSSGERWTVHGVSGRVRASGIAFSRLSIQLSRSGRDEKLVLCCRGTLSALSWSNEDGQAALTRSSTRATHFRISNGILNRVRIDFRF